MLFLFGQSEATATSEVQVTALDFENHSVKWVNPELGLPVCKKRFFELLPDHFPVLYREVRANPPDPLERDKAYVVLVSKRNGAWSGEPLAVPMVERRQDCDLLIRPGRIIIGTNGRVHVRLLP
jgi:hypothetical protein